MVYTSATAALYYAPGSNDRGHIVFVLSVCLSVCLSEDQHALRECQESNLDISIHTPARNLCATKAGEFTVQWFQRKMFESGDAILFFRTVQNTETY